MGTNKKHFSIIKTMVIVQKCVFTGSELISDAFDGEDCFDGRVFKCKSELVNKEAMKFDIGDSDDVDDQDQTVNNIVDGFENTQTLLKHFRLLPPLALSIYYPNSMILNST